MLEEARLTFSKAGYAGKEKDIFFGDKVSGMTSSLEASSGDTEPDVLIQTYYCISRYIEAHCDISRAPQQTCYNQTSLETTTLTF